MKLPFGIEIEIDRTEVAAHGAGLVVGGCTGYVTENIIDSLMPILSGPAYIAGEIGKFGISAVVASMAAKETSDTVRTVVKMQQTVNTIVDEILEEIEVE